jgi:hypothetical protein
MILIITGFCILFWWMAIWSRRRPFTAFFLSATAIVNSFILSFLTSLETPIAKLGWMMICQIIFLLVLVFAANAAYKADQLEQEIAIIE